MKTKVIPEVHNGSNPYYWQEIFPRGYSTRTKYILKSDEPEHADLMLDGALKKHKVYSEERHEYVVPVYNIDNALTVKVPENEVNCVLTMFGECSYNKTGCSDCEIKDTIRKALTVRQAGEWKPIDAFVVRCSICGVESFATPFCSRCGADMRGKKNEWQNMWLLH